MSYWTEVDPPMSFIPEGWTYDQKRNFRHQCIPYLRSWARFDAYAGKRMLCIGDGSGIDAVEFAKHGASVTVLDMSRKAIALSETHAVEAGVKHAFFGVEGDATKIKVIGQFDVVYSFGVIHHIPDVEKAVSEISRVLKPGGEFFGMVYHKDSLLYAYSILRRSVRECITADEAMRMYSERNPGCPCSRAYTKGELAALLTRNGLKVGSMTVLYDVIDMPEKRKVPFNIDVPGLGWHLCFRAVKP